MITTATRHRILAANADQVWRWFQERGGIAVWKSVDFSTAGQSWTTPLRDSEGNPMPRQNWRMEESPSLVITDPAEVMVDVPEGNQAVPCRGQSGRTRAVGEMY